MSIVSAHAKGPMIVAHRGASKDAPQNTLPAFKLAFTRGADAIEGDFHLTKDGHIVCIHDGDTRHVAKENLRVSSSTLDELRALDIGSRKGEKFKGTRIPTIAEVFDTIPKGKKFFIEIKCGEEIIPPLLEEIKKSGLKTRQIVVICFNAKVLRAMKQKAPEIKVSWLCDIKKNKKTQELAPSLEDVLKSLKSINADGLSSTIGISNEYISEIKAQGYEWHVWTVNDEETARRMKELGVSSITTDIPGHIRKHLN